MALNSKGMALRFVTAAPTSASTPSSLHILLDVTTPTRMSNWHFKMSKSDLICLRSDSLLSACGNSVCPVAQAKTTAVKFNYGLISSSYVAYLIHQQFLLVPKYIQSSITGRRGGSTLSSLAVKMC